MDPGNNTWHNIMGEIDGVGLGLFDHHADSFDISKEKVVRVSLEALISEVFVFLHGTHPHQIKHPPCTEYNCYSTASCN